MPNADKVGCLVVGYVQGDRLVARVTIHNDPPPVFSKAVLATCRRLLPSEQLELYELETCSQCDERQQVSVRRVGVIVDDTRTN